MTDLLRRIQMAQIEARELAAINGTNIGMASILAGERVVVEHLRQIEARTEQSNVVDIATRRPRDS